MSYLGIVSFLNFIISKYSFRLISPVSKLGSLSKKNLISSSGNAAIESLKSSLKSNTISLPKYFINACSEIP